MPSQSVRSVQKPQRSAPPNLRHRSKRGRGRAGNYVDRFSTQQNHLDSTNNSQSDNLSNPTIQKRSANGISSIESDCNPTEVVDDSISQPGPTVNPNAEKQKIIQLETELRSTIEHLNTFKKTVVVQCTFASLATLAILPERPLLWADTTYIAWVFFAAGAR